MGWTLECYRCTYNELDTSHEILDWIFEKYKSVVSDTSCKLEREEDYYKAHVRECPEPSPQHVYKCGSLTGTSTVTVLDLLGNALDVTISYNTLQRDCIEVPKYDAEGSYDGCHDFQPQSSPAMWLLNEAFDSIDDVEDVNADVDFTGQACYDAVSNSAHKGSLRCPQCTWHSLDSDMDLTGAILRKFSQLSDTHCRLEDIDEDRHEVAQRICPPAREGLVSKCLEVRGDMTARLFGNSHTYSTIDRDCAMVDPAVETNNDGCQYTTEAQTIISSTLESVYGFLDLEDDFSFRGSECLAQVAPQDIEGYTPTDAGYRAVSGSDKARVVVYGTMLMVLICLLFSLW